MQSESGQDLDSIVRRKELERRTCGNIFFWGVGNAPSRYTQKLANAKLPIPVVFSVMRTAPKPRDVFPSGVFVWRSYVDNGGWVHPLPEGALVTSRVRDGGQPRHYALMCESAEPLRLGDQGNFDPAAYRNLGEEGGQIAASQVTILAMKVAEERDDPPYKCGMRARLAGSYWVRLRDPLLITGADLENSLRDLSNQNLTTTDWLELVTQLKSGAGIESQHIPDLPFSRVLH